jgi:hypothetical protein
MDAAPSTAPVPALPAEAEMDSRVPGQARWDSARAP